MIGVLQLTPIGFQAFLVFLLWTAVTSIVMAVRPPAPRAAAPTRGSTPRTVSAATES